ncbi:hypothetical protein BTN50_0567 [Candidatus Enterovibrio altilux]|uniref:Uncharacterized protein n=1 Tax=Candidatus Enterovibrio altilux TaxID=1927128 RepID=A0A291B7W6_9GAMM|nr:hypothetical protein BTN50_0567 [Candidatus Enterovibrio luxaltus]
MFFYLPFAFTVDSSPRSSTDSVLDGSCIVHLESKVNRFKTFADA